MITAALQPTNRERLSAPEKGRPVGRAADRIGNPLRVAVRLLIELLPTDASAALNALHRSPKFEKRSSVELVAWHYAARWLTGVALGRLSSHVPLAAGLQWFDPHGDDGWILDRLSSGQLQQVETNLRQAASGASLYDLLPYAFDPHGPGSRLSVRRDPTTAASRHSKRSEGVFYTPSDVADYMVHLALGQLAPCHPITFLDPACGTGVYLRAAFAALRRLHPNGDPLTLARQSLFGLDIDSWAVDAAAYVLTHDVLAAGGSDSSPMEIWDALRANLAVEDALTVDRDGVDASVDRRTLGNIFPTLCGGARVVLGNPPYASIGLRSDLNELPRQFSTLPLPTPAADVHPLFVEQMVRLSSDVASGVMVIPLSIAFNTRKQFQALRGLTEEVGGEWRFSFFDREPHALFGEDVKTRNAIVSWSRSTEDAPTRIFTGQLQKWRGSNRYRLFENIRFTEIHAPIAFGIPKLADDHQAAAYEALTAFPARLGHCIEGIRSQRLELAYAEVSPTVFVAGTAYNFLNAFRRPPRWNKPEGRLTENALNAVQCASEGDASAVYALLSSRVAYWLWHVTGDGFHVTRQFIDQLPLGPILQDADRWAELSEIGLTLWHRAQNDPFISRNAGRTSVAFPLRHAAEIDTVDALILEAANVNGGWQTRLCDFVRKIIGAQVTSTPIHY